MNPLLSGAVRGEHFWMKSLVASNLDQSSICENSTQDWMLPEKYSGMGKVFPSPKKISLLMLEVAKTATFLCLQGDPIRFRYSYFSETRSF